MQCRCVLGGIIAAQQFHERRVGPLLTWRRLPPAWTSSQCPGVATGCLEPHARAPQANSTAMITRTRIGADLDELYEETREVGILARHGNPPPKEPWGIPTATSGRIQGASREEK